MRLILLGMLFLLASCAEEDIYDLKYSECMQVTPDYSLFLRAPMRTTYQNGNRISSSMFLTLAVDSLAEPYKYQYFSNAETPPGMGNNDQEAETEYYLKLETVFSNCNLKQDTCYLTGINEGRTSGAIGVFNIAHKDTIGWPSAGGGWLGSGPVGATLQCQLDSTRSMVLLEPGNRYEYEFVTGVTLLDTVTDPAYRSIYQQWWPLPRKPWPKGESVIADSTIWADSVADSLEVWTYPWRHNDQDEFVEFPL